MGGIPGKVKRTAVDHDAHLILDDAHRVFQHIVIPLLLLHGDIGSGFRIVAGVDKVHRNAGSLVLIELDGKPAFDLLECIPPQLSLFGILLLDLVDQRHLDINMLPGTLDTEIDMIRKR